MKPAALALLALLLTPGCSAPTDAPGQQAPVHPMTALPERPAGLVLDQAGVLPPEAEAALDGRLRKLASDTGDSLVVVTVDSLHDQPIETYATALFNDWDIGTPGERGLLVLVAPNERQVRIEVGCAAESTVEDAVAAEIIGVRMLPRFRESELAAGTLAGVDALIERLALPRPANDPGPHTAFCKAQTRNAA